MGLLPARTRARIEAAGSITDVVRGLDPQLGVPGLADWECIPTPGHTPGHVAYLRRRDGVLLAGDAALTVDLNSVDGLLFGRQRVAGPPWYMTWDWPAAKRSVQVLAELEPRVLLPGHGRPLTAGTATMLHAPWPRVARAPTGAEVCACGACCLATAAPTGTGRLQGCTPGCSGWASR
jgi:glyoxylase-like metal-dependent hydrolase (beta-lactamase superfamily II)